MRVLSRQCARQLHNMTATQATFLFCTLLQAILTEGHMAKPKPEFLAPLENHTVTQGRDIYFTCVVNHLSEFKVAWIKSDSKAILAINNHMIAQNQRLSVTHNGHNTWKLHVSNVQKNDSGTYMCQLNTDPMRSQMGNLEVVIPPDILNDNESAEGAGVSIEGGTIRLRCYATGMPRPTVLWRREDSRNIVFRQDGGREKSVRSFDGEMLTLTNVHRTDMGSYLCIASNGVPPSVSKRFMVRVHFHPVILVEHQLIAAPIASDVPIQCQVQASPKTMNHWMRDNGEKLMANEKYFMEEIKINEYSLYMNLTIRNLEKGDFGGYICTSSNALGKADGNIRLQERRFVIKSTSTASTPRYIDVKPRKTASKDKSKKFGKQQRKKESGDSKIEEDQEMTTQLLPGVRTQSPSQISLPAASRSPPSNHFNRSTAGGSPFEKSCCYSFIAFVMLQLYTVHSEIV